MSGTLLVIAGTWLSRGGDEPTVSAPPSPRVSSVPVTASPQPKPADGGATWLSAGDPQLRVAALTTRDVTVLPAAVPGLTTVTWTATNAFTAPVTAVGLVIYRDAAGKLLGAHSDDTIGDEELVLPPGDSTGSITFRSWSPPGTDRSRLQVTLRPGNLTPDH